MCLSDLLSCRLDSKITLPKRDVTEFFYDYIRFSRMRCITIFYSLNAEHFEFTLKLVCVVCLHHAEEFLIVLDKIMCDKESGNAVLKITSTITIS